jgi:hypothetical protein
VQSIMRALDSRIIIQFMSFGLYANFINTWIIAMHGILLLNENPSLTTGPKQESPQTVPKKNTLSINNLNILEKLVFGRRFDSRRLHHSMLPVLRSGLTHGADCLKEL